MFWINSDARKASERKARDSMETARGYNEAVAKVVRKAKTPHDAVILCGSIQAMLPLNQIPYERGIAAGLSDLLALLEATVQPEMIADAVAKLAKQTLVDDTNPPVKPPPRFRDMQGAETHDDIAVDTGSNTWQG